MDSVVRKALRMIEMDASVFETMRRLSTATPNMDGAIIIQRWSDVWMSILECPTAARATVPTPECPTAARATAPTSGAPQSELQLYVERVDRSQPIESIINRSVGNIFLAEVNAGLISNGQCAGVHKANELEGVLPENVRSMLVAAKTFDRLQTAYLKTLEAKSVGGLMEISNMLKASTEARALAPDFVSWWGGNFTRAVDAVRKEWGTQFNDHVKQMDVGDTLDAFSNEFDLTRAIEKWDFKDFPQLFDERADKAKRGPKIQAIVAQYPSLRGTLERLEGKLGGWISPEDLYMFQGAIGAVKVVQPKVDRAALTLAVAALVPCLVRGEDATDTLLFTTDTLKVDTDALPAAIRERLRGRAAAPAAPAGGGGSGAAPDASPSKARHKLRRLR